jgi:hypothetical protein
VTRVEATLRAGRRAEARVKLPAGRVNELLEAGAERSFEAGHGRVMREWVALPPSAERSGERYVRDPRSFVEAQARR